MAGSCSGQVLAVQRINHPQHAALQPHEPSGNLVLLPMKHGDAAQLQEEARKTRVPGTFVVSQGTGAAFVNLAHKPSQPALDIAQGMDQDFGFVGRPLPQRIGGAMELDELAGEGILPVAIKVQQFGVRHETVSACPQFQHRGV